LIFVPIAQTQSQDPAVALSLPLRRSRCRAAIDRDGKYSPANNSHSPRRGGNAAVKNFIDDWISKINVERRGGSPRR